MHNIVRDQRGQTFIELLTAIFVLSVALVGALSLATSNTHNQTIGSLRLTASGLAREGVEIARALRDSNWLAELPGEDWDIGLRDTNAGSHCAVFSADRFAFDFVECKKDGGGNDIVTDPLYRIYRGEDGSFTQSKTLADARGTTMLMYRKVHFDPVCLSANGNEHTEKEGTCPDGETRIGVAVTSEVWWEQGRERYTVKVAESLTNWR